MGANNRIPLRRNEHHGEERDPDAQQHTFGETKDPAELPVERLQFDLINRPGDKSKQHPNDERRAHVNRRHCDKLVRWRLFAKQGRELIGELQRSEVADHERRERRHLPRHPFPKSKHRGAHEHRYHDQIVVLHKM